MKNPLALFNFLQPGALVMVCAALAIGFVSNSARAGSATWTGSTSGNWNVNGNWNPTSGYPNAYTDVATFNDQGSGRTAVSENVSSLSLGTLTFDAGAGTCPAYTITIPSGNTVRFGTPPGTIQMNSGVQNSQIISGPTSRAIRAYPASSGSSLNILNNATDNTKTLTISGQIVANNTTYSGKVNVLTLGGANTGANTISGTISDYDNTDAYWLAVTKSGAGSWILSGANTYSGATTISAGTLKLSGSGSITPYVSTSISIAAGATFDVSGLSSSTYTLNSLTTLSATGSSSAAATIVGASSGTVSLGSQAISLTFAPTTFSGDTTHPALVVSQGAVTLNGAISVNNAGGTALGAGTYTLISVTGKSISGSPTLSGAVGGSGLASGTGASIQVDTVNGNVNLVVTAFGITSATTSPSTITREGSTSFSVSLQGGTSPYTVTVDYSLLEGHTAGTDLQPLSGSGTGPYTGSAVTPSSTLAVGTYSLPVTATDSSSPTHLTAGSSISVTVTDTLTWNVATPSSSSQWSTAGNWSPNGPPALSEKAIFGATGTSSGSTTVNNVVDASFGGTVAALTYNQTSSGQWHVTQIPASTTLTVNGTTTVGGGTSDGQVTSVAMTGGGTFAANGDITIGNNGSTVADTGTILDLSALTTFTCSDSSGTLTMGTGGRSTADFKLAQTSTVTVNAWNADTASSQSSGTGTLTLGTANTINVGTFNIAEGRSTCTVQFPSGSGNSLTLRGKTGGSSRCTMALGFRNFNGGSGGTTTGTLNLNGNSVDMKLGTLTVGEDNNTSASGNDTGTGVINFDTGAIDATTITMAIASGTASYSKANGTITVGASGTLTVGTGGMSLANLSGGNAATGTLNISGGTVTCNGNITKTSGTASIVFISGGTLNMGGNTIGASGNAIDTFTLDNNATFQCAPASTSTTIATVGTLTWPSSGFTVTISSLPGPGTYHLFNYATLSGTFSQPGTLTLPAGYTGQLANSSPYINLTVMANPAFSGLTASQTIAYGATSITLSGKVSASGPVYPANGETVTVTINGNAQSTAINDSTGDFSFGYNPSTVLYSTSPYTITYSYAGDTSLNSASDTSTTLTVNPAATTNSVAAAPDPSLPGASVTFTAALGAVPPATGIPAGVVQFKTNGVPLGDPVPLNGSGVATLITTCLPHGSNTVSAEYAGDARFLGSTNSLVQVVNTPPTSPNSTASVMANQTLVLSVAKLLARASDADAGDTLSIVAAGPTSTNGPAGNVVLDGGAGTVAYTPASGYVGPDSFIYTISDNYGGTVTPTVYVTVTSASGGSPNVVSGPTYANGTFSVTFAGIPNLTYTVQYATDPSGPWTFLGTATAGTNGLFEVTDTQLPPPPARYYRTGYP